MAETVFGENYIKSTFKEFCENTNLCGFEAYCYKRIPEAETNVIG